MSGTYGTTRRSRTRSPIDEYAKRSILAKVSKSEFKLLRVAVRRGDVVGTGPQLPLERNIDDPVKICAYVHYRKDESERLQPPIFKRKGIKVNQDFTENRHVFTHNKDKDSKPSRRSRSGSRYRSRSPRNQTSRSPNHKKRDKSQERSRRSRSFRKSRSRSKSARRSNSTRNRSRSRDRRYSSERRKYSHLSSRKSRYSRSQSRSTSPHDHDPNCPVHGCKEQKKSLTPLRPGEYRPGHPDLTLRNKRQRSSSRSYDDRLRSKRSRSRDDLPSTSGNRSSPGKHASGSKTIRRYQSPGRRVHRSRSRSPVKSERYRRRSRSPYNIHSPTKRSYRRDKSRSPRRRSRSPHYGEDVHGEYGYYKGWGPGPRLPVGRGGYPLQPFYAPAFHPRGGMIPGPIIPPGHMIVPRMPIMPPYGPYGPRLPIYNSGAVRQRGPRPIVATSTVTSEKNQDGDNESGRVVISEASSQDSEKDDKNVLPESTDNSLERKEDQTPEGGEK